MTDRSPRALLEAAERMDGYQAACAASPANKTARAACHYTPFSLEREAAESLLATADSIPLLRRTNLVILHPTADNGWPHTRPGSILCIPAGVAAQPSSSLRNTLLHEAMHLHQRDHSETWLAAIRSKGWSYVSAEQIPANLRERCRINPDTLSSPYWAWDRCVPLPLFPPGGIRSLGDATIKWYDLRAGSMIPRPPPSFQSRWSGAATNQPEHPFEVLANEYAAQNLDTEQKILAELHSI